MISKELLSAVLSEHRVVLDYEVSICETEIHYGHTDIDEDGFIVIYELAHKSKMWAKNKGYWVQSMLAGTYGAHCGIGIMNSDSFIEEFRADTEPEAIFKACQWILEKETK